MIYVTGDTHGNIDIGKFSMRRFPEQKEMTKDDYMIVCGDFGLIWNGDKQDLYLRNELSNRNFTTLFVDGNHENHHMLNEYPVKEWNGGLIHEITPSIFHLMRGQVFTIDGKKFFTMGGARSHDVIYRRYGVSWWPEEMPSPYEYALAINNIALNGRRVDYVISHAGPTSIIKQMNELFEPDELSDFLNSIKHTVSYDHWYFGHYHMNYHADEKHTCLYHRIERIV